MKTQQAKLSPPVMGLADTLGDVIDQVEAFTRALYKVDQEPANVSDLLLLSFNGWADGGSAKASIV